MYLFQTESYVYASRGRNIIVLHCTNNSLTAVVMKSPRPNLSSRTMVIGSTQPLTEMSTRNLPGGKGRQARGADKLTAICEPIVLKMWEPRLLTTLWAFTACYWDTFTFLHSGI
jgi:hypothetical protein